MDEWVFYAEPMRDEGVSGFARRAFLASELLKKANSPEALGMLEDRLWMMAAASLIAGDPDLSMVPDEMPVLGAGVSFGF